MIPKTIHYIWLSGEKKPRSIQKNLISWKKHCPDYEIREWTANDIDLDLSAFLRDAYNAGKWSFASDYLRLWILYNYGGIYLDSDVEVIKSFDDLLHLPAFSCFENNSRFVVEAGVIGAEKGFPIIKEMLDIYNETTFINRKTYGKAELKEIIPDKFADCLDKYGFKRINKEQTVNNFTIFPSEYFSPINTEDHKLDFSSNTYAVHYFSNSVAGKKGKRGLAIRCNVKKYGKFNVLAFCCRHPIYSVQIAISKLKKKKNL